MKFLTHVYWGGGEEESKLHQYSGRNFQLSFLENEQK